MLERGAIKREEYQEVQRHEYKGVCFFTAVYNEHIVLEPIHQEVLDALTERDHDYERLWSDSGHTWARNMSLQEQRAELVKRAQGDIDYLLSGLSLKEQRRTYLSERIELKAQLEFFKSLKKRSIGK